MVLTVTSKTITTQTIFITFFDIINVAILW